MSKLYLYSVFHSNLAFSTIPVNEYAKVIDRCYWPLLNLVYQTPGLKIGWEFTGYTLERISEIDGEFILNLNKLCQENKVELIGSGYNQIIGPLVPVEINRNNFTQGNEVYFRLFGFVPRTVYVNEQVYSAGLVGLYRAAGYDTMVMDWNNPYKYNHYKLDLQYYPQYAVGPDGKQVSVLWNNTVSFQKFQRYVHGESELPEYLSYLNQQVSKDEPRSFAVYGNDVEIFNYRPGNPEMYGTFDEFDRMKLLFTQLVRNKKFKFYLPREIVHEFRTHKVPDSFHSVKLESAEYPLPCKKQEKYNPLRWAVAGRNNTWFNTQCYRLYHQWQNINSLTQMVVPESERKSVLTTELGDRIAHLWASDYRSFTSDDKYFTAIQELGATTELSVNLSRNVAGRIPVSNNFVLVNLHSTDWEYHPTELNFASFPVGKYKGKISLRIAGKSVPHQVVSRTCYPDGSLRSLRLVVCPYLKAYTYVPCELRCSPGEDRVTSSSNKKVNSINTDTVNIDFIPEKGYAVKSVKFKHVAPYPLSGTLPHGFYEDIAYSADFFTGHSIIFTREDEKVTDLVPSLLSMPETYSTPIYIPLRVVLRFRQGTMIKTYRIYRTFPRVDLSYEMYWHGLTPTSFRLGIVTFMPDSFNQSQLVYATTNGGTEVENFSLTGKKVDHSEPVSLLVTAKQCLGATEGWLSVGDEKKQVALIANLNHLYTVPMVKYEELENKFFLRVMYSISELDDTSQTLWRGYNQSSFTLYAHHNQVDTVRKLARYIQRDLLMIPHPKLLTGSL